MQRYLAIAIFWLAFLASAKAQTESPLTTCGAVRGLSRDVASQQLPVAVSGVVTFAYPIPAAGIVIQDHSGGIYVDRKQLPPEQSAAITRGARVELRGVTSAGNFAPIISATEIRPLGQADLPAPTVLTVGNLLTGRWDCRPVEVRGVVHGASLFPKNVEKLRFHLVSDGGRIAVHLLEELEMSPERFVDSEVVVRGIAFTFYNRRGELVGARVQATSRADVQIVRLSAEDPFAVPEVRISSLRPFSSDGPTHHRQRVSGTVTVARPGQYLYLQENGRGIRVSTSDPTSFGPGDRIEASGFVEMAQHFGEMRGALVRRVGSGDRPAPRSIRKEEVVAPSPDTVQDLDGTLITLQGVLEKLEAQANRCTAFVRSEGQLLEVDLGASQNLAHLQPESFVQVNGVARVQLASGWPALDFPQPIGFGMIAHSPEDIRVLRSAPWWTPRRLALLALATAAALVAVLSWNFLLRRRVEQRGTQLAEAMRARREAAVEFEATLRERERVAADLHDTLEQALTGLALQLEAADALKESAPGRSSRHLTLARHLLASSRDETRRSVWNLRRHAIEGRALPDALRDVAASMSEGQAIRIQVDSEANVEGLPDFIAGNLLLLAQEALTNAVKHGSPANITLQVTCAENRICLLIQDDGRGFSPESVRGVRDGHFGLQGMKERMKRLGGELEIASSPGQGTRIRASAPL